MRKYGMHALFSLKQKQILDGSMLGDGTLDNQKYGHSAFIKNQSVKHRAYVDWHMKALRASHMSSS